MPAVRTQYFKNEFEKWILKFCPLVHVSTEGRKKLTPGIKVVKSKEKSRYLIYRKREKDSKKISGIEEEIRFIS